MFLGWQVPSPSSWGLRQHLRMLSVPNTQKVLKNGLEHALRHSIGGRASWLGVAGPGVLREASSAPPRSWSHCSLGHSCTSL